MENLTLEKLPQAFSILWLKIQHIEELLLQGSNKSQPESDQLLTIQQCSDLINLTVPTIYGLVAKSAIPSMKKNKRLYFSKQELIKWIKTGRKKTVEEIQSEADQFLSNHKHGRAL